MKEEYFQKKEDLKNPEHKKDFLEKSLKLSENTAKIDSLII